MPDGITYAKSLLEAFILPALAENIDAYDRGDKNPLARTVQLLQSAAEGFGARDESVLSDAERVALVDILDRSALRRDPAASTQADLAFWRSLTRAEARA